MADSCESSLYRWKAHQTVTVEAWRVGFDEGGWSEQRPSLVVAAGSWLVVRASAKAEIVAVNLECGGRRWWQSLELYTEE